MADLIAAVQQHGSKQAAARALDIPWTSFRRRYAKQLQASGRADLRAREHQPTPEIGFDERSETARVWSIESPCLTWQDALAKACDGKRYDPDIWEVVSKKAVSKTWTTAMKLESGNKRDGTYQSTPHLEKNHGWHVEVTLKRKAPKALTDGLEEFHRRAERFSPKYKFPRLKKSKDPHLYVVSLYDHHFGKLCWAPETGENYDLQIADTLFAKAGESLLRGIQGYDVERFLLPIGNDFLHVDSSKQETAGGTRQDTEGRYAKMVGVAAMALVKLIDLLANVAAVDVVLVRGNHDKHAAFHLAREMAAWYRLTDRVSVDHGFAKRKFYEYGATLLGMAHGDTEHSKWKDLVNEMPYSRPHEFARTTCHEWHLGHHHREAKRQMLPVESVNGTTVRTLPSLTKTDSWHYEFLYYGKGAAEGLLYSKRWGYVGTRHVGIDEVQAA